MSSDLEYYDTNFGFSVMRTIGVSPVVGLVFFFKFLFLLTFLKMVLSKHFFML